MTTPLARRPRLAAAVLGALALATTLACGERGYTLDLSTDRLTFVAEAQGSLPAAQAITAHFSGDGLVVGYPPGVDQASWLTVVRTDASASPVTFTVGVKTTSLPPGAYRTTLRFVTGKQDGSNLVFKDVAISYTVARGLQASVASLAFAAVDGQAPPEQALWLTSATPSAAWALSVEAGAGGAADWLSLSATSGTLAGVAIELRVGAAARPPGSYSATLVVRGEGGTARARIPVSYQVTPAFTLSGTAAFSVTAGTTPAGLAQPLTIHSLVDPGAGAAHRWQATSDTDWLSVLPASGDLAADAILTVRVLPEKLSALANGSHRGTITVASIAGGSTTATASVDLGLKLPEVDHVAPNTTWVGAAPAVILRGSGFGAGGGTLPVRFGSEVVSGTVLSDTEIRVTAPAQAVAALRVPVQVENGLSVARRASELVVLRAPAYAAHQATVAGSPTRMTLDPERQAVLLSGSGTEIRRFRFASGAWVEDAFQAPSVTGAYVSLDGKSLLATSGNTGSSSAVFLELDPDTFAVRKTTAYPTYHARYDLVAGLNDGRVLIIDSEQWGIDTIWYPSLAKGLSVTAWNPRMLVTRDRSRMIVSGRTLSSYDVGDAATRTRSLASSPSHGYDWSVSGDGGRFVVGSAVYDRDFAFLGGVSLPETSMLAVAVAPAGDKLYTLARDSANGAWVFRRASVAGAGPFVAEATPLPFSIGASELPVAMAVSEDGGTLFLLTRGADGSIFRALPL